MWNKLWPAYIGRIRNVLLWFALAVVCFAFVFYLQDVPLAAAGYAALLAIACGAVFLAVDFLKFAAAEKKLQRLLMQEHPIPGELPVPADRIEADYQALVRRLYADKLETQEQWSLMYTDLLDYYTLWVHQIKTPISALNLLLQTDEGAHAKEMSMELFKIEQYTEMVLQYLRLGSLTNDFVLQPYALDEIVRQALRKYAKLFIGSGVSAKVQKTGMRVVTDEKWLLFVLEQLLSNALKYTAKGAISIYSAGENSLTVEDTGMGISPEDLPRIFEKGYTGFNGRVDKKSTGLGLYLVKQILDKLGHTIKAESKPGEGSRFTIVF